MFTWKILEIFSDGLKVVSARYLLTLSDDVQTVATEGHHVYKDKTVNKPLDKIVESDLTQWIEKDISVDEVNPLKSSLETQLKALQNVQKVDFPWFSDTFTME